MDGRKESFGLPMDGHNSNKAYFYASNIILTVIIRILVIVVMGFLLFNTVCKKHLAFNFFFIFNRKNFSDIVKPWPKLMEKEFNGDVKKR